MGLRENEMEMDVARVAGFPVLPDPLAREERTAAYGSAAGACAWLYMCGIRAGYEITDAIDLIVSDPGYAEAIHRLIGATKKSGSGVGLGAVRIGAHDRIAQLMLPADARPLADEATRLLQAVFDWTDRSLSRPVSRASVSKAVAAEAAVTEEMQRRNLLWFMSDPAIPSEIAAGRLGAIRVAAVFNLLDLRAWIISSQNPAHDMGFALSDEAVLTLVALLNEDLSSWLKLLASFPNADIAETLVPACDRHDIGAMAERQDKIWTALTQIAQDVQ